MTDIFDCDRCGSTIVTDIPMPGMYYYSFDVSESDDTFRQEDRRVCTECVKDIVKFIDESSIDRSDRVDPVSAERLVDHIVTFQHELDDIRERLEADTDD